MSALVSPGAELIAEFDARFEKLNRALDEALAGWDFKPAPRKKKKSALRSAVSERVIKHAAGLILSALRSALLNDPDGFGALDYYQLKAICKVSDGTLGLALNDLIPSHLRTRSDGVKRIYFLPREMRVSILKKTRTLKRVA